MEGDAREYDRTTWSWRWHAAKIHQNARILRENHKLLPLEFITLLIKKNVMYVTQSLYGIYGESGLVYVTIYGRHIFVQEIMK